eukprot:GEMP01030488.1.p1 GENE.GEMP01030488.1~~GEMP01030488.1.p1  ORF type:complete len:450 (+),score=93.54 GEMP01030488.1:122-1471(+)
MFRPELMDVGSGPTGSIRISLYSAAVFMAAEFVAVFFCCTLCLRRGEHLAFGDLRTILAPLIVYDFVAVNFSRYMMKKQRDMLLPSERVLREFHLISLLLRGLTLLALCLTSFHLPAFLRGFVLILAFGGTYLANLTLNSRGPNSTLINTKIQVWDLPVFIFVLQMWLRMDNYNQWSWTWACWPVYFLATILLVCSSLGCLSAESCSLRTLFQAAGIVAGFIFWVLHGLTELLDGQGTIVGFSFPLFLLSMQLMMMSIVLAVTYVFHRIDENDDDYMTLDEGGVDGPPLRRDESLFLEAVSTTFYKTVSDLPHRIVEWFRGSERAREGEEMQALSVRPFNFETCSICCDNDADAVFLHCGHGGVCHQCATFMFHRSGECCICRAPVQGVAKITQMDVVAEDTETGGKADKTNVDGEEKLEEGESSKEEGTSQAPSSARGFVKAKTLMAR